MENKITRSIIKSLLEDNNYSQEQLAKILDVSQKAISNWVNGNDMPKASSMILIYKKFGITPNQLLGIDPLSTSQKFETKYNIGTLNNHGNIDMK